MISGIKSSAEISSSQTLRPKCGSGHGWRIGKTSRESERKSA